MSDPTAVDQVPGYNHNIPLKVDWRMYSVGLEANHAGTWQDRDDNYWLQRLMQEVGELASALADDHDDPAEWELMQIRAIAGNWLAKMQRERIHAAETEPR